MRKGMIAGMILLAATSLLWAASSATYRKFGPFWVNRTTGRATIQEGEYNVLDYGADDTGAADSTSAIAAAEAVADDDGSVLFLPPGTYDVTSVNVSSNVKVKFAPGAKLTTSTSATVIFGGSVDIPPTSQAFDDSLYTYEHITNGTFTDLTGWTGTGWTAAGTAVAPDSTAALTLTQAGAAVVSGVTYALKFDLIGATAGTLVPSCGGVTQKAIAFNPSNKVTYRFVFTTSATTALKFQPAASTYSITAVADYSATVPKTVLVTAASHGMPAGDSPVTISGTTDYNGPFTATYVGANTFYIYATYTSSQTGTLTRNFDGEIDNVSLIAQPTFTQGIRPTAYPEWWGAVADDATDDYAALQAAIDACVGGHLTIPVGVYVTSEGLRPTNGMTIKGLGCGSYFVVAGGTKDLRNASVLAAETSAVESIIGFMDNDGSGLTLRDLTFTEYHANMGTTPEMYWIIPDTDVNGVEIRTLGLPGIWNTTIENCGFLGISRGVHLWDGPGSDYSLEHTVIRDCRFDGCGKNVIIDNGNTWHTVIESCWFSGTNMTHGIHLIDGTMLVTGKCYFTGSRGTAHADAASLIADIQIDEGWAVIEDMYSESKWGTKILLNGLNDVYSGLHVRGGYLSNANTTTGFSAIASLGGDEYRIDSSASKHYLAAGQSITLDDTGLNLYDGVYEVASIVDADSFTVESAAITAVWKGSSSGTYHNQRSIQVNCAATVMVDGLITWQPNEIRDADGYILANACRALARPIGDYTSNMRIVNSYITKTGGPGYYGLTDTSEPATRYDISGGLSLRNAGTSSGYQRFYADTDIDSAAYVEESIAIVDLAAAAIKDLADTPIQLVAAPGSGRWLEFCGASLWLDYTAPALAEPSSPDDLCIEYDSGTGPAASATIVASGFITATADTGAFAIPVSVAGVATTSIVNKNLALVNTGTDYTDGGSALRVIVRYRVHSGLGL